MTLQPDAVVADISMSLDGFITGPDPDLEHGLGRGGEALHQWVFRSADSPQDRKFLESAVAEVGAVIMGRRTFDIIDGPYGWNEEINYGYDEPTPSSLRYFVVTHGRPETPRHQQDFTYVTDGVASAVEQAQRAAAGRQVSIMSGDIIAQALEQRLIDALRIHLSPVIMGRGTPLFARIQAMHQLEQTEVIVTDHATHLTYRPS